MKTKKNNFFLLLTLSAFFHLLPCICSFYLDSYKGPSGYKEVNYWCNFFSYGSVQASLVTIIYFIYKLLKKSPANYFDKIFDLIVINANITSISIFTVSVIGGGTAAPYRSGPIKVFSLSVDRKVFGGSYSIIGHYLATSLAITYFVRRKISLAGTYFGRKRLFGYSFLHPLFYLVFVLGRPHIRGSEVYQFGSGTRKSPYPYFFFDGITKGKHNTFLGSLLVIAIICLGLALFWLSTLFFWGYAGHKLKLKAKKRHDLENNKMFSRTSYGKKSEK